MATIVTRAGKGSALTWTEGDANITNLNNDKIEAVVDDTTPQLGGNLDVNGKQIVSTSNGNISIVPDGTGNIQLTPTTGHVTISATNFPTGTGTNGQVLTTDGTGNASWSNAASGGLANIVEDTTPQLGGALDVNGQQIVSTANGNISIVPDGTGDVFLTSDKVVLGDPGGSVTLTSNGSAGITINTDSGTNSGSIFIGPGVNQNISITPNGTGKSKITNLNYNEVVYTAGSSATFTPTISNGNIQKLTLSASSTFTLSPISGGVAGDSVTLILTSTSTIPASITTSGGTWKWAGGVKTFSGVSGAVDIVTIFYDGTTHYASISKGFV